MDGAQLLVARDGLNYSLAASVLMAGDAAKGERLGRAGLGKNGGG
jgi:hypothetical protein